MELRGIELGPRLATNSLSQDMDLLQAKLTCIMYKHLVRTAQKTHSDSVIKSNQLKLHMDIIAVHSDSHTKHINTLCGQKVELLNVKLVVLYV
jgi:hypothetical protein